MLVKSGCRTLSLETRRLRDFTRSSHQTSTSGSSQTGMFSTVSGQNYYKTKTFFLVNWRGRYSISQVYWNWLTCYIKVVRYHDDDSLLLFKILMFDDVVSGPLWSAAARCTWRGSPWTSRPATSTWPAVRSGCLSGLSWSDDWFTDGWTKTDLIYVWKAEGALQFADNLSLPGGFLLANTGNQYCDVVTSTGQD